MGAPGKLTSEQEALLALLVEGPFRRAPSWKRSMHEFILEYGWWYEPAKMPAALQQGPAGKCFRNAFSLALENPTFTYCEGVTVSRSGLVLIKHGWVTDGSGRAIDSTLDEPAGAYAGVPFRTGFVSEYFLRSKAIVCLFDDYMNDWPLLGALGDRPEVWLEAKGKGTSRCQIERGAP